MLDLGDHRTSRSLHLPNQNLKSLYGGHNWVQSCIPFKLLYQGCILKMVLVVGMVARSYIHSKDKGEGEEPLIAQIQ